MILSGRLAVRLDALWFGSRSGDSCPAPRPEFHVPSLKPQHPLLLPVVY